MLRFPLLHLQVQLYWIEVKLVRWRANRAREVIKVEHLASLIGVGAGLVGLIVGYYMGYRSGSVAGELAALKATRQRHNRHETRRRNDRAAENDD